VLGETVFTRSVDEALISKTIYDPHMVMAAHAHGVPYVSLVVGGRYTEHREDAPRQLVRKMLVYHPAGEVHADCVHESSMETVNVEYHGGDWPREFFCAQGPTIDALTDALLAALHESGSDLRCATARIGAFLRGRDEAAPPERMVAARDALASRRVADVASDLGIHRVQLHRAFKRAYGESPRGDVSKRRLGVAATLLVESKAPIAAVAAECGFYDQSHFCRQFKALTGLSPSRYRTAFSH
jgi:AraC family transcriptional regulator